MNFNEMIIQIDRLKNCFSEKSYPKERVDLLYQKLKWKHEFILKTAVDELIGSSQYAPLNDKIFSSCVEAEKKYPEYENNPWKETETNLKNLKDEVAQCPNCFNDGYFTTYRRDDPLMYQVDFICTCKSGIERKKLPSFRLMPVWNIVESWKFTKHLEWISDTTEHDRFKEVYDLPKEQRLDKIKNILNFKSNRNQEQQRLEAQAKKLAYENS